MDWIVDRLSLIGFGSVFGGFLVPIELLSGCEGFAHLVAFICAFLWLVSLLGLFTALVVLRVERIKLDKEIEEILSDE